VRLDLKSQDRASFYIFAHAPTVLTCSLHSWHTHTHHRCLRLIFKFTDLFFSHILMSSCVISSLFATWCVCHPLSVYVLIAWLHGAHGCLVQWSHRNCAAPLRSRRRQGGQEHRKSEKESERITHTHTRGITHTLTHVVGMIDWLRGATWPLYTFVWWNVYVCHDSPCCSLF